MKDFIKIVRPYVASVGINGLRLLSAYDLVEIRIKDPGTVQHIRNKCEM